MKRNKKILNKGPYMVDECYRGDLSERSKAVVMDNTMFRKSGNVNKLKVAYFITENPKLLAGKNTVALFKLKQK